MREADTNKTNEELEETERRGQEFLADAQKKMDSMLENVNKALEKYKKKSEKKAQKEAKKAAKKIDKQFAADAKIGAPQSKETLTTVGKYREKLVEIRLAKARTKDALDGANTDEERKAMRSSLAELDKIEKEVTDTIRQILRHGVHPQRSIFDELREYREAHPEMERRNEEDMSEEEKASWKELEDLCAEFEAIKAERRARENSQTVDNKKDQER